MNITKKIENIVFESLFGIELHSKPLNGWIILEERLINRIGEFEMAREKYEEIIKIIERI